LIEKHERCSAGACSVVQLAELAQFWNHPGDDHPWSVHTSLT